MSKIDKEHPNSQEAEKTIVSLIMQKPKYIDKLVEIINPEMFYNETNRIVYITVLKMYDNGNAIDMIEVLQQLKRDNNYVAIGSNKVLVTLYGYCVATSDQIRRAYIIREMYMRRMSAEYGYDISVKSLSYESDLSRLIDSSVNRFATLQSMYSIGEIQNEIDSITEAENEALKIIRGEVAILDTPFLDYNKYNFFLFGKVLTISARPRMGKTALALTMAEHWSKNHKVYFISLEMNKQSMQMRRMSWYSGTSIYDLYHNEELLIKAANKLKALTNGNIEIDDRSDISTHNLSGIVRQAVERGCKIIILDYIQLLESEGHDETARITNATRLIQKLAKRYDVLFVQLSQLNRGSEGAEPKIKDNKGSGAIEEVSDYMLAIDRPEVYAPHDNITVRGESISPEGMAKLMSQKDRMGASDHHFWIVFEKEAMKFKNYSSLSQWNEDSNF